MLPVSGTGPTETVKRWNSPALMPTPSSAVQVTSTGASVMVASSVFTGVSSFSVVTLAVQPGTGSVERLEKGASFGRSTVTLVVVAVADSVGTLKVNVL